LTRSTAEFFLLGGLLPIYSPITPSPDPTSEVPAKKIDGPPGTSAIPATYPPTYWGEKSGFVLVRLFLGKREFKNALKKFLQKVHVGKKPRFFQVRASTISFVLSCF
jgi:hypothetical protein